jgi:DNA polymerase-4
MSFLSGPVDPTRAPISTSVPEADPRLRSILHLDLDAFFAAVESRDNRKFRGKPLLIGGGSGRGVVASCSYEARQFGIHAAMPMKQALRRCPEAVVLRGDMEKYSKASELVTAVIAERAPLYEKSSIDEFYLDLTGMDRFIGTWQWSQELKQTIVKEAGLPLSIGLAANKLIAKVDVNLRKPDAATRVPAGHEKRFLDPLPIRRLPGVGSKTNHKLAFMGVNRIGTLAGIPPELLVREFGKTGKELWRKANGIDFRPVIPYRAAKSMSKEKTFQRDTIDLDLLRGVLTKLTGLLAFELRQAAKLTSVITVKIRYADFNTYTRQCRIPYTAGDRQLITTVLRLFEALYTRRQLIRLVGVRFSGLVAGNVQVNLFEDTGRELDLLIAMDRVRKRFGTKVLGWGNTLGC